MFKRPKIKKLPPTPSSHVDAGMREFLKKTLVGGISAPATEDLLLLDSHADLVAALQGLSKLKISSAPVVDPETREYAGFVDSLDILDVILEHFDMAELLEDSAFVGAVAFLGEQAQVKGVNVKDIANASSRNPFISVPLGCSLMDVVELLGKKGLHRVAVIDGERVVKTVITQSAIVKFLAEKIPYSATNEPVEVDDDMQVFNRTVNDIGLAENAASHGGIVCVDETASTVDAFRLMRKHKVSAVPVLDEDGCILGSLSARDIKALLINNLDLKYLRKSVMDFLSLIHKGDRNSVIPAIRCSPNDRLGHVVHKLAKSRIHRVWVVDAQKKVVGVVSLRDVLNVLAYPERVFKK